MVNMHTSQNHRFTVPVCFLKDFPGFRFAITQIRPDSAGSRCQVFLFDHAIIPVETPVSSLIHAIAMHIV
eukprot:c48255_g1_i1 orf=2-208(-)